jgi:hypothetical protein
MHKKKNPLNVLSGELVLNFRKAAAPVRTNPVRQSSDSTDLVRRCCEDEIVERRGASTEDLHHAIVPCLLEHGVLTDFAKSAGDLTPIFQRFFEFDESEGKWHLTDDSASACRADKKKLLHYLVVRILEKNGSLSESSIREHLGAMLGSPPKHELQKLLRKAAVLEKSGLWTLRDTATRPQLFLF